MNRHVFIDILQTEHFTPVNFDMGYKKNMSFEYDKKKMDLVPLSEKLLFTYFFYEWWVKIVLFLLSNAYTLATDCVSGKC